MIGSPGGWARAALVAAAAVAVGLLALRLAWPMLAHQLTYPGGTLDPTRSHPSAWGLPDAEEVWLTTVDGVRLHAWWVPASATGRRCGAAIYHHGNGEAISNLPWVARQLADRGFDVLLYDYRGYGLSEGTPTEDGLRRDARAAWSFVVNEKGVDPASLLLIGHSLGSAVAAGLALEHSAGAVVLVSAFPGLPAAVRARAPWFPLRVLAWEEGRYESGSLLHRLETPLLLVAGTEDRLVPHDLTRAVHQAAPATARLALVPATHNTVVGHPETWRALDAFVGETVCRDPA